MFVGGSLSGGGGDGVKGTVTVTITGNGTTQTAKELSYGLLAQSIGGGGGYAGFVAGNGMQVTDQVSVTVGGLTSKTATPSAGGNAETASIIANGVNVGGPGANGLVAQSIGAGGGLAGFYSGGGIQPALGAVTLGGSTAAGDAAAANVTSNATVAVNGAGAVGILTQSIGGGGGAVQVVGASVTGATLTLGAGNGAGGNGGDVNVTNAGPITTASAGAHAILAQSIGGGGGFFTAATQPGDLQNVAISAAAGGTGGNSGKVTVANTHSITTLGTGASGIIAQSIAGGGGLVGGGVFASALPVTGPFAGSVGGAGNAGAVDVSSVGAIQVLGASAYGIFAQSAAGTGTSGPIIVRAAANVSAQGANSTAILAQSSSGAGNGDITVDVAPGMIVTGGSGGGSGIQIKDGAANTLTNAGTITTASGIDGFAIRGTVGDDRITNTWLVIGSVDVQGGANAFDNKAGAVLQSGTVFNLGAGNTLTNQGFLLPGNYQRVLTTNLSGNFVQTATGTYGVDLDLKTLTADRVTATGIAVVAGIVNINLINPNATARASRPGTNDIVIVNAAGGASHAGLALVAPTTAVSGYSLQYPNANDIVLRHTITYTPIGMTSGNQLSVGNAINAIQGAQTSPKFGGIATALFFQPNNAALGKAYDSISGSAASGTQQLSFAANDYFMASIGSRAAQWLWNGNANAAASAGQSASAATPASQFAGYSGLGAPVELAPVPTAPAAEPGLNRWRSWAAGFAGNLKVAGNDGTGSVAGSQRGGGLAAGIDVQTSSSFMLGIAGGGGTFFFSAPQRATSGTAEGGHIASYGAYRNGQFSLVGTLALSQYENVVRRFAAIPGGVQSLPGGAVAIPGFAEDLKGSFASRSISGDVEAGYRVPLGRVDVTPFAGLQFGLQHSDCYAETLANGGASQIGLTQNGRFTGSLPTSLGLQIKTEPDLDGNRHLQAWARAAWRHEWLTERSTQSAFLAAPGFNFTVRGAQPASDTLRASLGARLMLDRSVSLFAILDGDFSSAGTGYSGQSGIRLEW